VRYTPAGLPAIDCRLQHESTATEDGQPRRVSLEIKALAIGAISRPLGTMVLGSSGLFAGFLASARNGRGLLFHITELTPDAMTSDTITAPPPTDSMPTARLSAPI
jgi:primosomal replication protein N